MPAIRRDAGWMPALLGGFAAFFLEGHGVDEADDEGGEAVVVGFEVLDDGFDGGAVVGFDAAAEGVGEHFFGDAVEVVGAAGGDEDAHEFFGGGEAFAGFELADDVDGKGAILFAVFSDGVEVFEAEADGVHLGVAGGADGILAVDFHLVAEGATDGLGGIIEYGDVGRGRRGRSAEEIFEDEFSAFDGRCAGGVGGEEEEAAFGDDAHAVGAGEGDFLEFVAGDAVDAVEAGEAAVDEGVVGGEEFGDGAVVAHDVVEEEFGFALHGFAEAIVEIAELLFVGGEVGEVAELEPLAGEVFDEGVGFGGGEHAGDLGVEGFAEFAALGDGEEFIVGGAAPEEVAEARGQGEFRDIVDGFGVVGVGLDFATEEEVGGYEDGFEGEFEAVLEGFAVVSGHVVEVHEGRDVGVGDGAAEGAAGELGEDVFGLGVGAFGAWLGVGKVLGEGCGHGGDGGRAVEVHGFEVVDDEVAVGEVGVGVFGIVEGVEEGGGEADFSGGEMLFDFVDVGAGVEVVDVKEVLAREGEKGGGGEDVEGFDGLVVDAELHLGGIGTGLMCGGFGAEEVVAFLGNGEFGGDFAIGFEDLVIFGIEFGVAGGLEGGGEDAMDVGFERTFDFDGFEEDDAGVLFSDAAVEDGEFVGAAAVAADGGADFGGAGREADAGFVDFSDAIFGGVDFEVFDEGVADEDADAGGVGLGGDFYGFAGALADEHSAGGLAEGFDTDEVIAGGEREFDSDIVFFETDELDPTVAAVAFGVEADFGLGGGEVAKFADGGLGGESGVDNAVGGGEVFFHEDGGEGEDVAVVVESVADVVFGEIGAGVKIDAEEIADGVAVFTAIEAADGDAAGIGMGGVVGEELAVDEGGWHGCGIRRGVAGCHREAFGGCGCIWRRNPRCRGCR